MKTSEVFRRVRLHLREWSPKTPMHRRYLCYAIDYLYYEDDFLKIINKPDKYMPEIWHRKLERVLVGHWFFGLLPVYAYYYTEWTKENEDENK